MPLEDGAGKERFVGISDKFLIVGDNLLKTK
jgi:hypothetical protein